MKRFLAVLVVSLFSASAMAQGPWYAKGTFQLNQWSTDNPMTQDPLNPIHWTTTVGGDGSLFDNTTFDFKLATENWSDSAPSNNASVTTNAAGAITFQMWDQTTWTDGWFPNNNRRVGYDDPLEYGWQVMGSFDGFSTGLDMVNQGNGLYTVQAPFNAGFYDFKFRQAGTWDGVNFGPDFSNGDHGNNSFAVANNGDVWQFSLDLPNGRWQAVPVTVDQHGDYNGDGNTDAADYVYWRKNMAGNTAKYDEWRANFGRTTTLSWVAHGTFGNDVTLTSQGSGVYTASLTGLTPGTGYDVQVFRSDASSHWPGTPAKITADGAGNINLKYYELQGANWNDGWSPDTFNRVGYTDPQQFGWEVIGQFNNWPPANDPAFQLASQGNGLYAGTFAFQVGTYDWKFRRLDSVNDPWGTSIGPDFGNGSGNNSFTVANDGDLWTFELDLTNGRWKAFQGTLLGAGAAIPEPGSLAFAMFGLALAGLVRRK